MQTAVDPLEGSYSLRIDSRSPGSSTVKAVGSTSRDTGTANPCSPTVSENSSLAAGMPESVEMPAPVNTTTF